MARSSERRDTASSEPVRDEGGKFKAKPKWVRYMGTAHVREITREQWEEARVNDQDSVYWTAANGWTVPASAFNEDAWPFIEADELLFVVYDEEPGEDIPRTLPTPPNVEAMRAANIPHAWEMTGDQVEQEYTETTPGGRTSADGGSGGTGGPTGGVGGSTGSSGPSTPSAGGSVGGSTANTGT